MKKALIIFTLGIASLSGFSQNKLTDVVYLNDGSIIKGSIIEYFVNDHVIIKSASGKTYSFLASEIKNVNVDVSKSINPISTGFFNNTSFGLLIGAANYNNSLVNFTFNTINGYQFNDKMQAGVGLGMDIIYGKLIFPLFVDLRYYLRKSAFSPYVGAFWGYSLKTKEENSNYNDYYYRQEDLETGRMYGFELGIKNYTKENLGYTLSLGYRFQYLSTTYNDWGYNTDVLEEHYINRFKLTMGVIFN